MTTKSFDFSLAYYSGNRKTGQITLISEKNGQRDVYKVPTEAEGSAEPHLKPILLGMTVNQQVVLLDPKTKHIRVQQSFPEDAFAAHVYQDPHSEMSWYMNDGDKESGNDTLNCGNEGSSVTIVASTSKEYAEYQKTVCVGRGHHQAEFTYPSDTAPNVPKRAYISNLKDGTLSVIGNDPKDSASYLNLIETINLCEPEEEGIDEATIPNNAFPHGTAYSPVNGKFYNLNNGYGNLVIIDPVTNQVEKRLPFKGHSNLFAAPDGQFIMGRGADRKSDPNHVLAKVSALDVRTNEIVDSIDIPDIYISKYYYNPEGSKLYLTTSSSGSDEQKANLKTDAVLVFDLTQLPKIVMCKELRLGSPTGSLDFLQHNGETVLVFASNADNGEATLIDGKTDEVVERIKIGDPSPHSRLWLIN